MQDSAFLKLEHIVKNEKRFGNIGGKKSEKYFLCGRYELQKVLVPRL